MAKEGPVAVEPLEDGAYWRVFLDRPKGNILDGEMFEALTAVFRRAVGTADLKALCLEGRGSHFSFGASVPEHMPEHVEAMLRAFHGTLQTMLDGSYVVLAAVRGQCLGGGLELVSCCQRVFASNDARLGQPEIVLGVFPPVASVILPERVGRANAEDLCLSGRVVQADEAQRMGLVDVIAEDPSEAALEYAKEYLLPHSASSLRYAVKAGRYGLRARFAAELEEVERIYLKELMATGDAVEGLQAFMEKREPKWKNR
jgi:cyclohexa-1,5-dienecarbonyl-CoA hydratase